MLLMEAYFFFFFNVFGFFFGFLPFFLLFCLFAFLLFRFFVFFACLLSNFLWKADGLHVRRDACILLWGVLALTTPQQCYTSGW